MKRNHVLGWTCTGCCRQRSSPALPQSAIRLLNLSRDPNNGPAEFAEPVEADPGLAAQLLRFVNSSFFGFAREIASVKLAITLVGIRSVKNFALWSAVFSLMPNPKCGPFDLRGLWQDSLRRALFARTLARLLEAPQAEEAFAASLLQDMAIPLLAHHSPAMYSRLLEIRGQRQARLSSLERQIFGWTHAEAGGMMARHWNLPDQFARLIENHVSAPAASGRVVARPADLAVALSAMLPSTSDASWLECADFENAYESVRPVDSPALVNLLSRIDEDFAHFAPFLNIVVPAKTLLDHYREMVAVVA